MTVLLVARHGNTFGPGDVVTRVGGRTDLPLVASGLAQGQAIGAYLKMHGLVPDRVFTSRLQRTRQTAEQAVAAIGRAIPIAAMEVFDEIDYGPDENRPETDVVARLGAAAIKAWDDDTVVPDGWRVDVEAIRNAWLGFAAMLVADFRGSTTLVVTSNGIARFAPVLVGELRVFQTRHTLKISTGALCRFDHDGTAWSCSAWNVRP